MREGEAAAGSSLEASASSPRGPSLGPLRHASLSSRGGRPDNQDRCGDAAVPGGHVFVVADGLGGHAGGAVAAEACVTATLAAVAKGVPLEPEALHGLFDAAHRAVQEAQRRDPASAGCRTTSVVLALAGGRALWGHVGDSRLYHFRGGRVVAQTLDHSVPQALVQSGALAPSGIRSHPDRNRLLRSLGGEGDAAPTLVEAPVDVASGDAFLLCSDGLWEHVTEAEMEETLRGADGPEAWLRRLEARVLAAAKGAFDNYTATGVLLGPAGAPADASRARRGGRGLRLVAAAVLGLCLGLALQQCFDSGGRGLVFGGGAAGALPAGVGPHGSGAPLRLHFETADPPRVGRP